MNVAQHSASIVILRFVWERIPLGFVYFVMNSRLFCYSTAIKSTLVSFCFDSGSEYYALANLLFLLVTRRSKVTAYMSLRAI